MSFHSLNCHTLRAFVYYLFHQQQDVARQPHLHCLYQDNVEMQTPSRPLQANNIIHSVTCFYHISLLSKQVREFGKMEADGKSKCTTI